MAASKQVRYKHTSASSPASVGFTQVRPNKRRQTVWGKDLRLRDILNAIQHTSSAAAKSKNFLTALQIAREQ